MIKNTFTVGELEQISDYACSMAFKFKSQSPPAIAEAYGVKSYIKAINFFSDMATKAEKMIEDLGGRS